MTRCSRCGRKLRDPVSVRMEAGARCRAAIGLVEEFGPDDDALDEGRKYRRRLARGRSQRRAEAHGQLRLPLQLVLPWGIG